MTYAHQSPVVGAPSTRKRQRLRSREWPRPPKRDPHTRLISQTLELAGVDSSVIATSSRPWASATFVGARHVIILALRGPDHGARAEQMAVDLPDTEFSISGHIVADACVDDRQSTETETRLRLTLLTIEDW